VTSTSAGVVGSVTRPSALMGSATASQSSALGPLSAPSPGTSSHMTLHSAHLSSLRPSYRHCTIHTTDCFLLSVAAHGTLYCNSFHVPDVSLVPDLTM
jgi:hypothetical protein